MTTNSSMQMANAQQLMLNKMQTMEGRADSGLAIAANPFDQKVISRELNHELVVNEQPSFAVAMRRVLDGVNALQVDANHKMTAVETGQSDDLVGAMIAGQKANLSFDALIQVRNRITSSFDNIMNMPV